MSRRVLGVYLSHINVNLVMQKSDEIEEEEGLRKLLPGLMTTPIPYFSDKTVLAKLLCNLCFITVFKIKQYVYMEGVFFNQHAVPWFILSWLVTVQALLSLRPDGRSFLKQIPFESTTLFYLVMGVRLSLLGLVLQSEKGRLQFYSLDLCMVDVSILLMIIDQNSLKCPIYYCLL